MTLVGVRFFFKFGQERIYVFLINARLSFAVFFYLLLTRDVVLFENYW